MLSGPENSEKSAEKPKEHHSLGSKIIDVLTPHHHHKHDKDKDKKKKKERVVAAPEVVDANASEKAALPPPSKKHHHHKDKTVDGETSKHHHHHHHRREKAKPLASTTPAQQPLDLPDTAPTVLKVQTPPPALEPLPRPAPKAKESAEGKVLKAMTASDTENAKAKDVADCCKPPKESPKQDAKKSTWTEWAQTYVPGARLVTPLFALHQQAGEDWVNDLGKVFAGASKKAADLKEKTDEVVSGYKSKLRPRSK